MMVVKRIFIVFKKGEQVNEEDFFFFLTLEDDRQMLCLYSSSPQLVATQMSFTRAACLNN